MPKSLDSLDMSESSDSDAAAEQTRPKKMDYTHTVVGRELYNFWGGKVIEHTTASGEVLARKVKTRLGLSRSEAELMHYAVTHGVLTPQVRGVYDVRTSPTARIMVMDRVPGVPLSDIWPTATRAEREKRKKPTVDKFVLTHGDLAPRNIMAQNGVITGIIDWQRGGFYPEWAEYAFAMELGPAAEKWFLPVLQDILPPCSKDRLKFTKLAESMGYVDLVY